MIETAGKEIGQRHSIRRERWAGTNVMFRNESCSARTVIGGGWRELFTRHPCSHNVHGREQTARMSSCIFCDIVAGDVAADVVYADDMVVAFLDRAPVFKGHVLVVPRRHVATLVDLPSESIVPFFSVVQRLAAAVPAAMDAHGTFVAINNTVSQSVPHLHAHVVPRRRKDGLRGFFWPRVRYSDASESSDIALRIRARLAV